MGMVIFREFEFRSKFKMLITQIRQIIPEVLRATPVACILQD